jgi:hypothetical protein
LKNSTRCLLLFWGAASIGTAAGPAADKFIPTYLILYGNPKARPAEETARFDMLVSSFSTRNARLWAAGGRNSWQVLKALNPNMVIVVYGMGPGEYNTADWGQIGEGWEWLKQHHGNDSEDRWTARGARYGEYLQNKRYSNERLMNPAKPGWQEYWLRSVYHDYWGGAKKIDLDGVDGIFSDNTSYAPPFAGQWYREGEPDKRDDPAEYFAGGKYLLDTWREGMNSFFARAVPFFRDKHVLFTHNFESLGKHPDWWRELDRLPNPPFAAMDEGGFICPWGSSGNSRFRTWDWEPRVRVMRELHHVRILMNAHATVPEGEGLEKMEVRDGAGMNGWDALWFSLTSFLLGFDDVARNAYMNFTVWSYSGYYWFDEFDPKFLHLGRAKGEFHAAGPVFLREFDDGFVVVNPGAKDAVDVAAPAARVRVLNHANFRAAESVPEVSRFDLPAHRGAILLKHGRKAGNQDNGS